MRLTLGKKIVGGFLLVSLLVAAMTLFTFWQFYSLNAATKRVTGDNTEKLQLVLGAASDLANEAVVMRRFNFTGNEGDMPIYNQYKQSLNEKLARLDSLIATEGEKKLLQTIKAEKMTYETIAESSFQAKRENNMAGVSQYMQQAGQPYKAANAAAEDLVKAIHAFIKTEEQRLDQEKYQIELMLLVMNIFVPSSALAQVCW